MGQPTVTTVVTQVDGVRLHCVRAGSGLLLVLLHGWDQVERLAVLDIVPTQEMFRRLDASLASGYWHWLFRMQPDLPERLVGHDMRGYLEYFFARWTYNRHGRTADAVDGCVRPFSRRLPAVPTARRRSACGR
ncbi:hypothetical protein ACFU53_39995 [Streptomyces sp. NPDC057474]|uniref:hypothetical protein n=1 Tax=Streptomyces sp. NPDC057474 TaxID=3346144 RepID=UPI00368E1270